MQRSPRNLARSSLQWSLALLIAWPVWAQKPPPPAGQPEIELGDGSVIVRAGTPGGRFVLFGVAQEREQFITTIVRREQILSDDDGDGMVVYELGGPVAFASAWAAVDLSDGRTVLELPPGLPRRELALPAAGVGAALDRLTLDLVMAEILVVRPGVGAWGRRAGDGGASDEDGEADGTIHAALAGMWSLGESPPAPERLAPGDVVVVIEPQTLGFAVVRLEATGESTS